MSRPQTYAKYTGATPAADSNTYVLFDSSVAFNFANAAQMLGFKRLCVNITHAAAGTLKMYKVKAGVSTTKRPLASGDWVQVEDSGSIAAPAAEDSTTADYLVETFRDFKLEWVNGGSSQAAEWHVDMALTDERVIGN